MTKTEKTYSLDEISRLTAIPRRTIRYYIQIGLVPPPEGETRAATYHRQHLDHLLEIRKFQEGGLSLDAIRDRIAGGGDEDVRVAKSRYPGAVEVWSHITLSDGVELHIEPGRAGLTPEQVRKLTKEALRAFENLKKETDK